MTNYITFRSNSRLQYYMNFKKWFILTVCATLLSFTLQAQVPPYTNYEVGGLVGIGNYFGDINHGYSFKGARPAVGVFYRYNFGPYVSWKSTLSYTNVSFKDALSKTVYQQTRNLDFFTNIFEVSSVMEIGYRPFKAGSKEFRFAPHLFAGLTLFHFDPKTRYNGRTYSLQKVGTEGQNQSDFTQREPYALTQMAIPFGIGFRYNFSKKWNIGFELGYRKLFTDYLDDVSSIYLDEFILEYLPDADLDDLPIVALSDRSGEIGSQIGDHTRQRGFANSNDSYMIMGFTLSYTVDKIKCPK